MYFLSKFCTLACSVLIRYLQSNLQIMRFSLPSSILCLSEQGNAWAAVRFNIERDELVTIRIRAETIIMERPRGDIAIDNVKVSATRRKFVVCCRVMSMRTHDFVYWLRTAMRTSTIIIELD